jgi:hypothetical protein
MTQVTRHAQGGLTQLCQYFGKPIPTNITNATINEAFNVVPTIHMGPNEYPIAGYFMIGNGGATGTVVNGRLKLTETPHLGNHTNLYSPVPFLIRPLTSDVGVDRTKYFMRKIQAFNGISYACYYAKAIDLNDVDPVLELRTISSTGVVTATPFSHTATDMQPAIPTIGAGQTIGVGANYIAASAIVQFNMDSDERDEFVNACSIIFGDSGYDNIFELAIVGAVKKQVTVAGGFTYDEIVDARILSSISTSLVMGSLNTGVSVDINVSIVDGLLEVISL